MRLQHFQFDNKAPPKAQKKKIFQSAAKSEKKARQKIIAEAVDAIVTLSKAITHPQTVITMAEMAHKTERTGFKIFSFQGK